MAGLLYLTGSVKADTWRLAKAGALGVMMTPRSGYRYGGGTWAADNGCYSSSTYVGDDKWLAWLARMSPHADACLFATAPDVVGDHDATLARSAPFLSEIRRLGYKAAFVLQDGATVDTVPWGWDAYFVGGTDDFKLGPDARALIAHAKSLGKLTHMGRVNSQSRLRYAQLIGCDSADGTFLAFGYDTNLPRLQSWLRGVNDQLDLLA